MWGSYGIHTIMIRDKDYSLQTCQQFIFVNQASCYMKKDTYEHTGETTCAVNVEENLFVKCTLHLKFPKTWIICTFYL